MKIYDCLGIHVESGGVDDITIASTDEKVMEWCIKNIREMSPTVQVKHDFIPSLIPISKNLSCRFSKMGYQQFAIAMVLIQNLCHSGWEPFGATSFISNIGFYKITLRRCCEDSTS